VNADKVTMEKIVSDFIRETCTIRPRPNRLKFDALTTSYYHNIRQLDANYMHKNVTQMITGSISEFFIEPMLPFIGDIDIMWYDNNEFVVLSVDHYTELPPEFHIRDEIEVFEMIDSQFPGYVFIRFVGKLVKCRQQTVFEFKQAAHLYDFAKCSSIPTSISTHGPSQRFLDAFRTSHMSAGNRSSSVDMVQCIRCLDWPKQAEKMGETKPTTQLAGFIYSTTRHQQRMSRSLRRTSFMQT
jgi:hypothetical protein